MTAPWPSCSLLTILLLVHSFPGVFPQRLHLLAACKEACSCWQARDLLVSSLDHILLHSSCSDGTHVANHGTAADTLTVHCHHGGLSHHEHMLWQYPEPDDIDLSSRYAARIGPRISGLCLPDPVGIRLFSGSEQMSNLKTDLVWTCSRDGAHVMCNVY